MSTGVAPVSTAMSRVSSVSLKRKIRACNAAAPQLVGSCRIDADQEAPRAQRPNRVFEVRKRRIRRATKIDHVSAGRAQGCGANENLLNRQRRCVDDLGENTHVVLRQIEASAALAEVGGQVRQLVGASFERNLEGSSEAGKIGPATARHDNAIGIDRPRQTARDDGFGHEGRDLHADVEDRPLECKAGRARQDPFEPCAREVSGEK